MTRSLDFQRPCTPGRRAAKTAGLMVVGGTIRAKALRIGRACRPAMEMAGSFATTGKRATRTSAPISDEAATGTLFHTALSARAAQTMRLHKEPCVAGTGNAERE